MSSCARLLWTVMIAHSFDLMLPELTMSLDFTDRNTPRSRDYLYALTDKNPIYSSSFPWTEPKGQALNIFRARIRGGEDSSIEEPAEEGGVEDDNINIAKGEIGSSSTSSDSDDDPQGPFLGEDEMEVLNRPNRRRLLRRQKDHIVYNRFQMHRRRHLHFVCPIERVNCSFCAFPNRPHRPSLRRHFIPSLTRPLVL